MELTAEERFIIAVLKAGGFIRHDRLWLSEADFKERFSDTDSLPRVEWLRLAREGIVRLRRGCTGEVVPTKFGPVPLQHGEFVLAHDPTGDK